MPADLISLANTAPALEGLNDSPALPSRFVREFKRAITPIAESADLAIALIAAGQVIWVTECPASACAQATMPACLQQPGADGCAVMTSQVFCDDEYIGDLVICNHQEQSYLAGVIGYLARAAASRIAQERREESLLEELSASWESLEAVYEISADLRTSQNPSELLER